MDVTQHITNLSNDALKIAVRELDILRVTGVLSNGECRKLAKKITSEHDIPHQIALELTQNAIYRTAARRWAGIEVKGKTC